MHQQAKVRVWIGSRACNEFIRSAGLGINGQYVPQIWTINYKEGEVVTPTRVHKALETVKAEATKTKQDIEISRWEVLKISDVQ